MSKQAKYVLSVGLGLFALALVCSKVLGIFWDDRSVQMIPYLVALLAFVFSLWAFRKSKNRA